MSSYVRLQIASEIREAAKEMTKRYDKDLIGKIALAVYRHHSSSNITYEFGEEAQAYFDSIIDNLASQFNSHYDLDEDISKSQPPLSSQQRADIDVRTKAGELIGRLTCVMWICSNGNISPNIFTIGLC